MHQLQRRSIKKGKRCSAQLELDVPWALLFVARFSINSSPVPFFSLSHAFSHAPSLSLSSTPTHLTFSGGQTHTLTLAFFVFHSLSLSLTHSIKKFVSLFLLSTHTYSHTTPFSQQITHSLNHHLQPSATSPTISLYFSSSHTQPTKTLFLSLSLRM